MQRNESEARTMDYPTSGPVPAGQPPNEQPVWHVDGSQQRLAPQLHTAVVEDVIIFTKTSRRRLEIFLLIALIFISILVIALGISVYLVADFNLRHKVCTSEKCVRTASYFLQSINESVEPCDNFYNYVCGRWKDENPAPEPYWANNWFFVRTKILERDSREYLTSGNLQDEPISVQLAFNAYASCLNLEAMNENGIPTFLELLETLSLPKNPISESVDPTKWLISLAKTTKFLTVPLIIGSSVSPSIENSTVNQLLLSKPDDSITIPGFKWDLDVYGKIKKQVKNDEVKTLWSTQAAKMIIHVIKAIGEEINEEDAINAAESVLDFTRNLTEIESDDNVPKSILSEIPEVVSFDEMQKYLDEAAPSGKSKINLKQYFETLFENVENVTIDYELDKLLVHQKYYFHLISELLDNTDDKIINLHIWWNVLYALATHINEELANIKADFVSKILGDYPRDTRSSICLQTVGGLMSPAVGYFMVSKAQQGNIVGVTTNNEPNSIGRILYTINNLFSGSMANAEWMDSKTFTASKDKLSSLKYFVGIPEYMKNREIMDTLYNLTIDENMHLKNLLNLVEAQEEEMLLALRIPNNFSENFFNPATINAYYDPSTNSIIVPYGILQFPFYDLGLNYLNLGALGTILGHELSHAFDNTGRKYDKFGNVRKWWDNATIERYKNRTNCFKDQYDNFKLSNLNITIDGNLTLDENLADHGGLELAYRALEDYAEYIGVEDEVLPGMESFTRTQLFFIAFAHMWCSEYSPEGLFRSLADEHSPEIARVNIVLQNFWPFSKAFGCPPRSNMNPQKKCRMWGRNDL